MTRAAVQTTEKQADRAYKWIRAARRVVRRLVSEEGELPVRLAAVSHQLKALCKDWKPSNRIDGEPAEGHWLHPAPIPAGPTPNGMVVAADRLRSLLGAAIEAIEVQMVPASEGEFVRQGVWRDKTGEALRGLLREQAVSGPSEPDSIDTLVPDPRSVAAAENAIRDMARELSEVLDLDQ